VIFRFGSKDTPKSGTYVHPAMVTRVMPDGAVNVMVMIDGGSPEAHTGLDVYGAEPDWHDGRRVCWTPDIRGG
jgi:hypothetical protein